MTNSTRSDQTLAGPIRCILSDVDGVMTDGRIIYDSAQIETKQFHVRDGLAIKKWMKNGFPFCIITARESLMVARRAKELGIAHVSQGSGAKLDRAKTILQQLGIEFGEVCYIGDDLPDLPTMQQVGLSVAPADAACDVIETANWVLRTPGGLGAVREAIERILRAKDLWDATGV